MDGDDDFLGLVVSDVAHDTHVVAVCKDCGTLAQPLGVAELYIIGVLGAEQADSLEKLDSEEQNHQGNDSHQSYLCLFSHIALSSWCGCLAISCKP